MNRQHYFQPETTPLFVGLNQSVVVTSPQFEGDFKNEQGDFEILEDGSEIGF